MSINVYERNKSRLKQLAKELSADVAGRNEATTRLQIIDTLLFEVLGWNKLEAKSEHRFDEKYCDYLLGYPENTFLVEAKREGIYFELPAGFSSRICLLETITEGNSQIEAAIKQALSYAQERGVGVASVCNGHQLVAFLASRDDGIPPIKGKALVFESFQSMLDNFRAFWNCLSPDGIRLKNIYQDLKSEEVEPPPEKLSQKTHPYPGIKGRNNLQAQLKILGDIFLEDLLSSPKNEEEFLRECYCPSGALSQYALISKKILEQRYAQIYSKGENAPHFETISTKGGVISRELASDLMAASISRRPIIILGDVGVGKTIFLRNLIKVEAKEAIRNAIVIYVNFGDEPTFVEDLNQFVLKSCVKQLREIFGIDIYEANFVKGVYYEELKQFSRGIFGWLKEKLPIKFKERETEFLSEKIKDLSSHLSSCMWHISKGQKRQIVFILDNVDQRPLEFQDQVFLISESLAKSWPGTVFVSLRPDTFNRSRLEGPLAAYHPKVFTVSPPRVESVVVRRIKYAIKMLEELKYEGGFPTSEKLSADDMHGFLSVLATSFEKNDELKICVDNLSGGNVRQALTMLTKFIGSGHVNTTKIIDAIKISGAYLVAIHEFLRAVIFGDHEFFDPKSDTPVANLFDISSYDGREHFLLPILLAHIDRLGSTGFNQGFVEVRDIYSYLQNLGFKPSQIRFAIMRGKIKGLLETSPRETPLEDATHFRITTIGAYSYIRLIEMFSYLDAMLVDTPIVDNTIQKLFAARKIEDRLNQVEIFCEYLTQQWDQWHKGRLTYDWSRTRQTLLENIEKIRKKIEAKNKEIKLA